MRRRTTRPANKVTRVIPNGVPRFFVPAEVWRARDAARDLLFRLRNPKTQIPRANFALGMTASADVCKLYNGRGAQTFDPARKTSPHESRETHTNLLYLSDDGHTLRARCQ
jgi:hypothetical protein